jgi:predicted transcriptional regulator
MKLTAFGLCTRKLRLDLGMSLKSMADGLGITSAYLSAIELGDKPLPAKLADQAVKFLEPLSTAEKIKELRIAADASLDTVPITNLESNERVLVAAFARRLTEGDGVPDDVTNWLKR